MAGIGIVLVVGVVPVDSGPDIETEVDSVRVSRRDRHSAAAAADGVTIPDDLWFVDEGNSGRTAKKRAAYQAILRRAEAQRDAKQKRAVPFQRIDRLCVWAFSRVARNMFDCLRALATLDEADVDVISLTEPDAATSRSAS